MTARVCGERRKVVEEARQSSPGDFWLNRLFLEGARRRPCATIEPLPCPH
jgi:hypothetical protein